MLNRNKALANQDDFDRWTPNRITHKLLLTSYCGSQKISAGVVW